MCNVNEIARYLYDAGEGGSICNELRDIDERGFGHLSYIPEARDWSHMGFVVRDGALVFSHIQFRKEASKEYRFGR
ncbi:hypothetical protein [Agrobacterium sp. MCAB5]|uniref:hypothetical protein n=1 Tax=Agrobacterium sp. MCAB5 TaxID=3233042 RepID=UPI003F91A2CD